MKIVATLILFTVLQSCAVFDGYKDNRHTWYKSSLSKDEKIIIKNNGRLVKDWHGTNKNGDYSKGKLLVLEDSITKRFVFVEIGKWQEKHSASAKNWKAIIFDTLEYDNFGNLVKQLTIINTDNMDTQFDSTYQTNEVNDSTISYSILRPLNFDTLKFESNGNSTNKLPTINSESIYSPSKFIYQTTEMYDSAKNIQIVKTFYEDGQLKLYEKLKIINYSEYNSDYLKQKELLEVKAFNEIGKVVEPWQVNHWTWWSPTIKMK